MSDSEFARLARLENPFMGRAPNHTNALCACCGVKMWIVDGEEPICDECDEARQPLLAEIERLKAELAKFHKCDDSNGCCDEFGSVHIVDATDNSFVYDYRGETMRAVYHKVDE